MNHRRILMIRVMLSEISVCLGGTSHGLLAWSVTWIFYDSESSSTFKADCEREGL